MRIRSDYVFGVVSDAAGLTETQTTFTSDALARLPVVAAPDVAPITFIDPDAGTYEIAWVTGHTAASNTATIVRGKEGSTAKIWPSGTVWDHGPTAWDFSFKGVKCRAQAGQTVANNTELVVLFDSEDWDTNTFHDNVTNKSRITVPADLRGWYEVKGFLRYSSNTSGQRDIYLKKNGAIVQGEYVSAAPNPANPTLLNLSTELLLVGGDYIELCAYQTSGATLNLEAGVFSASLKGD